MRLILGALLIALSVPASAQQLSDYDAGVAARRAGEQTTAVALLDRWIADHPADADALVQRGYAHLALGNADQAARDFRAALAIAPNYADARGGLDRIADRGGTPRRGMIIAGGAWSDLAAGQRDWWEASLATEAPVSSDISLGGRANWYRRFGLEDTELEGRIAVHPSDNLWLRASIGGTPSADFRPKLAVAAGTDVRIAQGPRATILSLDAAWQRFPLQDVVNVNPGVTQYLGNGQWWATVRGIGVVPSGGSLEIGILGRIDYAPTERQRFFAGAVNGPDTDLGIVSRVTSVFAGAELPFAQRWSLLPSLSREWREIGSNRTELRIELKAAF